MPPSKLSPLQEQVLIALSGLQPAWTRTGGAALAGFHTKHRETRDLDLFFHDESTLGSLVADATHALQAAGMKVSALRTTATFAQLDVRVGTESVVVDLVADPTPIAEPAQPVAVGNATILVETPHQLLVNKLCALLSRSELRDLVDVRVLIESGLDLTRALADCPGQDAGFSPLTFAWSARALPIRRVASAQAGRTRTSTLSSNSVTLSLRACSPSRSPTTQSKTRAPFLARCAAISSRLQGRPLAGRQSGAAL